MVPVVLAPQVNKVLLEEGAHLDDAVGHAFDFGEPLGVEGGVVEDGGGDARAVDGGVGVERADQNFELGVDAFLFFWRRGDDGEGANTFAVEALKRSLVGCLALRLGVVGKYHVLSEALRQHDRVPLLDEVANGEGILVSVTTSKALVCHVEEGEVLLLFDHLADLFPLLGCWVDTRRVVGAGVQEYHRLLRRGFEISDHAVEVETDRVFVVVFVLLHL